MKQNFELVEQYQWTYLREIFINTIKYFLNQKV